MRSPVRVARRWALRAVVVVCCAAGAMAAARQARDPDREFDQIARVLELGEAGTVADVGAGGGQWMIRMAARVGPRGRVYGTEVKQPQVEGLRSLVRARKLENVEVVVGTQQDIGLPAGCCDALLLRLVYHAFDEPERMRDGLRRAMRPGGRVLVIDFRPSPDQLTEEMTSHGFERVEFVERWQGQDGVYAVLFRRSSSSSGVRSPPR